MFVHIFKQSTKDKCLSIRLMLISYSHLFLNKLLIDDSDNSEELDDLDIFMRNNRSCLHHGDYDGDYHSSGRHDFQNDWNSGSYSQSYDDFHDEQDDYDMMDDDF